MGAVQPLPSWLIVGPGDDAACFDGMAVTVDTLCEGVHWDDRLSPRDVGFKAVAVSVSDLAATGATPRWMVLSCAQSTPDPAWIDACAEGVAEAARKWDVALVGGDTTRSGTRAISITMGGPCAQPLTRAGARPGDRIWVTGTLGLAGAGYRLPDPPEEALVALRRPDPPLAFARHLPPLATAAMDLSDGLANDLPRLCAASGVGALVDPATLPCHAAIAHHPDLLSLQVGAGDDYQLLFTAPPHQDGALAALARRHGVQITPIGHITDAPTVALQGADWPVDAFSHWGGA